MALSTPAEVRASLGLDHEQDYLLFRLPDEAALDQVMTGGINRAHAYLVTRVDSQYYTGSATLDTDRDELFRGATEMLAGFFVLLRLKARKVFGTHFAVDSEDSSRYEELIDNEILKQVEIMIEPYVVIETDGTTFALPVFLASTPVDRTTTDTVEDEYDDLIRASLGLDEVVR